MNILRDHGITIKEYQMADNKPRPVAEFHIGYVKAALRRNGDFFNTTISEVLQEQGHKRVGRW
jgi:hypothetical protein